MRKALNAITITAVLIFQSLPTLCFSEENLEFIQNNIRVFDETGSWHIDIGMNNHIELFIYPDKYISANIYNIKEENSQTLYFAKFPQGNIQLELYDYDCVNGASTSGLKSAVVHYHDTENSDYLYLEGCAEEIPDYRLHDIWILSRIEDSTGHSARVEDFHPRLEFLVPERTVYGFDGCNEFEGEFESNRRSISLKNVHTLSDRNCNLSEPEQTFIFDLTHRTFDFLIDENILRLSLENISYLFQKTD